nr:hypothetical protein [Tanacetum cinerariifolium]
VVVKKLYWVLKLWNQEIQLLLLQLSYRVFHPDIVDTQRHEPAKRLKAGLVGKRCKPKSPLKLVDESADEARNQGPTRSVVFREPDSGRFQLLPEVQGKGKEKVIEEQVAHDILTLQTLKKKSPVNQYIFQRHSPTTTGPSGNAESPSLDGELADSKTESDKTVTPINKEKDASNTELTKINVGGQNEGHDGSNPNKEDLGQAGSNLGNAAELKPQPSHVVHAGPNLKPMDLAVSDSSTQQNPEQMDEEFTTTAYPNVNENLKLPNGDHVIIKEPASSTRTMSSLSNLKKELSFTDQFFMEKPQEEELEKTNVESEVSQCDLPTIDMKEILQQWMFEDNSYEAHDDHKNLDQMLLASKDKAELHLDDEETDFILDNAYRDNILEELNAAVIMIVGLYNVLILCMLMLFRFGVDATKDFKGYTLRDYYCWLKTYC